MLNLKKMLTKLCEKVNTLDARGNVVSDHLVQNDLSVSANSYLDVTFTRVTSGSFMGVTARISGTANAVWSINNVTASSVIVRLRNVSSNTLTGVSVDLWIMTKTT